ncbi:hypothetical protein FH972_026986 [Carpinus fangiana]|uniref:EF hand associated type-2 domain-containing protein n=1 Tax=Carpinus fangiana TaxID=176857 RepID=A0A5N6L5Z9_9ROSI|nr:hypothetical protein FH972_026986 [Carpinus fangiana]
MTFDSIFMTQIGEQVKVPVIVVGCKMDLRDENRQINKGANNTCKQVKCFNAPLQPFEIIGLKRVVLEKLGEGVNERGITWTGFLFLHQLHIDKRRLEITWTILRKFGYNNDLKLAEDVIPSTSQRAPDQVELVQTFISILIDKYL